MRQFFVGGLVVVAAITFSRGVSSAGEPSSSSSSSNGGFFNRLFSSASPTTSPTARSHLNKENDCTTQHAGQKNFFASNTGTTTTRSRQSITGGWIDLSAHCHNESAVMGSGQ